MEILQYFLTENECYQAGRIITPRGIMVHSTGVNQTDPLVFIRSWNKPKVEKCVHAFVGQSEIYQTLPWTMRAWHAGGSANNTHIGIEICEDDRTNATYFKTVYNRAVFLCAQLCKEFNLDPIKDIICHSEGYKLGVASNHADVMHWFPHFGADMDIFRNAVKAEMEADMTQEQFRAMYDELNPFYATLEDIPEYWRDETRALVDSGKLRGDGTGKLNIRHETLRAVIIGER